MSKLKHYRLTANQFRGLYQKVQELEAVAYKEEIFSQIDNQTPHDKHLIRCSISTMRQILARAKEKNLNMEDINFIKEREELNQQWVLKNWDNERCFGCNHIKPERRYFDCVNWKDCHECSETFCAYWWSLENRGDKQIYLCGGCKSKLLRKERRKKIF
jgi:hypothetical protein